MKEFFQPWRRTVGCVTLVIACVFMGGWCRSMHFYNKLIFPVGAHAEVSVFSTNQFVGVGFELYEGRPLEWLFLVKPRKSNHNRITEPTTIEGA